MASRPYSKAVLKGLQQIGLSNEKIIRISGLSLKKLNAMLEEKAAFSDAQLDKIEIATRKTAGQLAVIGAGIRDKAFCQVMDRFAKTAQLTRPKRKRARAVVG